MAEQRWVLPRPGPMVLVVALVAAAAWSVAVGFAAAGAQPPAAGSAPPGTATVTAVHGLRGVVADVYLDGQLVLGGFSPERTTDPMAVPAGQHRLEVRGAGEAATATPLVSATFEAPAGGRVSVVVHRSVSGAPTATAFLNDLSPIAAGQSRLVVRNAAAAQPVDVRIDGQPLVGGLASGREFAAPTSGALHELSVAPAGAAEPVVGPDAVQLAAGSSYAFYLIGSQAEGSLGWIFEQFGGLAAAPAAISTGSGGTAAAEPRPVPWLLVVPGVVVLAAGFAVLVRRRPSSAADAPYPAGPA